MKERKEQHRRIRYALIGLLFAAAASCTTLTSCNTMEGVGEDVQEAGGAIESSARQAGN